MHLLRYFVRQLRSFIVDICSFFVGIRGELACVNYLYSSWFWRYYFLQENGTAWNTVLGMRTGRYFILIGIYFWNFQSYHKGLVRDWSFYLEILMKQMLNRCQLYFEVSLFSRHHVSLSSFFYIDITHIVVLSSLHISRSSRTGSV